MASDEASSVALSRPGWRRWFRFSLRSLMLATAVVCAVLGLWIVPARKQRDLVAEFRARGATVHYCYERDDDGSVYAFREPRGPAWLRSILGVDAFNSVVNVELHDPRSSRHLDLDFSGDGIGEMGSPPPDYGFEDADLARLADVPTLRRLQLTGPQFSDAAIPHLLGLKQLREVRLTESTMTAEVLRLNSVLPNLQTIGLAGGSLLWERVDGRKRLTLNVQDYYRHWSYQDVRRGDAWRALEVALQHGPLDEVVLDLSELRGTEDFGVAEAERLERLLRGVESVSVVVLLARSSTAEGLGLLPQLRRLHIVLDRSTVSPRAAFRALVRPDLLEELHLSLPEWNWLGHPLADWSDMGRLTGLRVLSIADRFGVTRVVVLQLPDRLPAVETLRLRNVTLRDVHVPMLAGWKTLRRIEFVQWTTTGVAGALTPQELAERLPGVSVVETEWDKGSRNYYDVMR